MTDNEQDWAAGPQHFDAIQIDEFDRLLQDLDSGEFLPDDGWDATARRLISAIRERDKRIEELERLTPTTTDMRAQQSMGRFGTTA